MLRQELNLYDNYKEPLKPSDFLAWNYLLISIVAIFTIFILIYFYSLWDFYSLKKVNTQLAYTSSVLQSKVIKMEAQFPSFFFSGDINTTFQRLEEELKAEQQILGSVYTLEFFSKNLQAFSELIVPNVWLTQLNFAKNGRTLLITGRTSDQENLNEFVKNIETDANFKNHNVVIKNIDEVGTDKNKPQWEFNLEILRTL